MYIYMTYERDYMFMKQVNLNVPIVMLDELDEIAKRENKPRSYVTREMLDSGIKQREEKRKKNESK